MTPSSFSRKVRGFVQGFVRPHGLDAAARELPGVADALVAMTVEGAGQGAEGMAFDIVAGSLRDPFPFDAIDVPVHLFGGDADLNVGLEHLDWWAARFQDLGVTGYCPCVSIHKNRNDKKLMSINHFLSRCTLSGELL